MLAHSSRHLRDLRGLPARRKAAGVKSMLLEIRHLTQYRYDAPVRESVMELWVQPQKSASQRLISFELELDPAAQLFSYVDTFGNAVYHFDAPQPHDRLAIRSHSLVETEPAETLPNALDMGEWQRLKSEFVRGQQFDFLRPYGHAVTTPALEAFIRAFEIDNLRHADPLTAARNLCQTLYEGQPRATFARPSMRGWAT